jgi:hypothetical protein
MSWSGSVGGFLIVEQLSPTARRRIYGLNEGSERLGTIALRSKPPELLALDWGYPLTEIAVIRYKQSEMISTVFLLR